MKNLAGRIVLPMLFILPAAGCASIVDGTNQVLSVQTQANGESVAGAECALTSNKGSWFVRTPGTVSVHRGYDALNVKCTKAGYQPAIQSVASTTKGMAFGNLLFGGIIGAGVDMSDGAAYNYPKLITVPMNPVQTATASPGSVSAAGSSTQPVD